ncbi:segregation/condensation protein A [Candidatus Micrarchaeota archaeon]|nr:segregation/condensation protein A [Candidatus Micrarchaeota archaeon]
MDVNIRKIVEYPTWKEMLLDLVAKEELNPWDIDIQSLSDSFIREIKKIRLTDFHIPANLILAASILLRFKSEGLKFEQDVEPDEEVYMEDDGPVEVTMLELHKRIPPKRPVTLNELMTAMEQVFDRERKRALKLAERRAKERKGGTKKVVIEVSGYDIESEQDKVIKLIKDNYDNEKMITFSYLSKLRNDESPVYTLIPLLYVYQKGKIDLKQDNMFNEILIRWMGEDNG